MCMRTSGSCDATSDEASDGGGLDFYIPRIHPAAISGFALAAAAVALRGRSTAAAAAVLWAVTDVLESTVGLTRWSYLSAKVAWLLVLSGSLLLGSLLLKPTRVSAET
jgi:hypothetical protein